MTRDKLPIAKVLHILDTLPLPFCYKTKHLLDFSNRSDWMQDVKTVSLNTINITPMSFAGSSDVLPWNRKGDDQTLDGAQVDLATVKILRINTTKFTSDELAAINDLP